MTVRARVLIVVVLGSLSSLWAGPASGQLLPDGFSSQTAADLGGGVTGYDAAGNLYLLRPSWVTSSGQATLERISPSGERTALTVPPLTNAHSMAVAPDGRLFFLSDSRQLVRRDTDGTVTTLLTGGANEYFNGVALTSTGTLVVGRQTYDSTAGQWQGSLAVVSNEGAVTRSITTPVQYSYAVRADRSGNVLVLGSIPPGGESSQYTSGLVRVNPETGDTSVVSTTLSTSPVFPVDIAVDPAGQTLVSLSNNGVLAHRSESGSLSTVSTDSFIQNAVANASGSAVFVPGWKEKGGTSEQVIQRGAAVVVTNDCNGLGAWLLVVGAMVAMPAVSWRWRAEGIALSAAALMSVNIVRISMLCYLQASRPLWFTTFHEQVAPLIVMIAASACVAAWANGATGNGHVAVQ